MSADVPADLVEAAARAMHEDDLARDRAAHEWDEGETSEWYHDNAQAALFAVLPRYRETLLAEKDAEINKMRDAVDELREDESWHVGGAWGDYGEIVVTLRSLGLILGDETGLGSVDGDRSEYVTNLRDATEALRATETELDQARAELASMRETLLGPIRAEALRHAADRMPAFHDGDAPEWAITSACNWLRKRADTLDPTPAAEGGDE